MPFPKEAVEDAATPAKHRTLYLMDVGTPVLGLGWRRQGQSERLFPLLQSVWIRGLSHGAGAWSGQLAYLAKGDFAVARAILCVSDKHFSIMLDPALATQDVVNTGRHLVPLKVVPKPEGDIHIGQQSASPGKQVSFEGSVPNLQYQVTWA